MGYPMVGDPIPIQWTPTQYEDDYRCRRWRSIDEQEPRRGSRVTL